MKYLTLILGCSLSFAVASEKNNDAATKKEARQEIKEMHQEIKTEAQAARAAQSAENKEFFAKLKALPKEERAAALTKHFDQQFGEKQERHAKNYQKILAAIDDADLDAEVKATVKQFAQERYEKRAAFAKDQHEKRDGFINQQSQTDDKAARKENAEKHKAEMSGNRQAHQQEMKDLRATQRDSAKEKK